MKTTTKRRLRLALAIFAFCHAAAWGQVNVKGAIVNSTVGYQYQGAAPNGHLLCGNGAEYVDSAFCGATAFYQTISQNSVDLPQRARLDFTNNFTVSDESGNATLVELAATIHSNTTGNAQTATTATTASNANAVGGTALSGLCQTTGAGCPNIVRLGFATGCIAPTSSFATCTTLITWGSAFADTNYIPVCTGSGPLVDTTGVTGRASLVGVTAQTATTVTIATANLGTAGNVGFTIINCVGVHF